MDLIHEQNGTLTAHALLLFGFINGSPYIFYTGGHRREVDEVRFSMSRNQPCQGGFAASWRTPENQRLQSAVFEQPPYQLFRSHYVLLAHKLIQRAGAHSFRQRGFRLPTDGSKKVLLFQYPSTFIEKLSAKYDILSADR
jgi:hypothetical protein